MPPPPFRLLRRSLAFRRIWSGWPIALVITSTPPVRRAHAAPMPPGNILPVGAAAGFFSHAARSESRRAPHHRPRILQRRRHGDRGEKISVDASPPWNYAQRGQTVGGRRFVVRHDHQLRDRAADEFRVSFSSRCLVRATCSGSARRALTTSTNCDRAAAMSKMSRGLASDPR